ncbi:MAG: MBL fold metallo-hydrolase [Novosphingobium sp.]|nr:MBL fold metallo-hydrolase [Novosphingobium sp.]
MTMPSGAANAADTTLATAGAQIVRAMENPEKRPEVCAFFDEATFTVTYVVHDPASLEAAIVDSVLDYDPKSGRTSTTSADAVIAYVTSNNLKVKWHIETHAHADHLSAAPYLQERLGGTLAIGREIAIVQGVFGKVFNAGSDFARDGSQFDHLFADGETFKIGEIDGIVMHVPGHTPADMAYVFGDAVFVGDTLFMPDYGTARADFPGGDAAMLYRSIRRLLSLPDDTRLFMCHDYKAPGRDTYAWETTVKAQKAGNVHVHDGVSEEEFVAMRNARDATLDMPVLILPSVQVNMRAGHMPEPEDNGVSYLKIPINQL